MTDLAQPESQISALVTPGPTPERQAMGRTLIILTSIGLVGITLWQMLFTVGVVDSGFSNWRPVLYSYLFWALCLAISLILLRGEHGKRALFVLPAVLFTISMVVFPTIFGIYVAFTDWNLSSRSGRHFNGLDNFREMLHDSYFHNALLNTVYYVLSVFAQYAIAFGLALLLNQDIRFRKFFRVTFLIPFMLSPVAVSWMIGKSAMDLRFGPITLGSASARLGYACLFRHTLAGPAQHHGHGRMGLDSIHDDSPSCRASELARRSHGVVEGGRSDRLAGVLANDLPALAASQHYGLHTAHDF